MLLFNPNFTSSAADQVPPDSAVVLRQKQISMVRAELLSRMKKASVDEVQRVSEAIVQECQKTGVDPLFVLAIIESESGFDFEAVSAVFDRNGNPRANAKGLMQLIPSTARAMGVTKIFDPVDNVRGGIRYIRHLWDGGFGRRGGPESVLLAYNQGPGVALAVYRDASAFPARHVRQLALEIDHRYF